MRILHVVPSYLPAWRYGGPIRSVHGLARAQAAAGDRVEVFTTNVDGSGSLDLPVDRPVYREGVAVHYFCCGRPRRLYRSPAMASALRARCIDFDLLHLHSVFLWPTLAAAREAGRRSVPYVVSPRGMLVAELIEARGQLRKRLWIRVFERRTLARAAAIIATSDYEANEIRQLRLDLAPIVILPNGVALDYGEDDLGMSAALERFLAGGPFFLFLGRLAAKKSVDILLSAMARVPAARLILAGGDDEGLRGRLESSLSTLGLASRVFFAGEVRGAPKRRLLTECRALVLPSVSENLGNVVLEALASGRPALVTPTVGLAAEIRAHGVGVVTEASEGALVAALMDLWGDPAGADAMGARGRQWVESELSWSRIAERHGEVYARATRTSRAE